MVKSKVLNLLIALVLTIVFGPFFDGSSLGRALVNVFFTIIMVSGLYAVSENKKHLISGIVLGVPIMLATWVTIFLQDRFLFSVVFLSWVAFDIFVAFDILKHILKHPEVSLDTIFGAISVYLLLGMAFGAMYVSVEGLFPNSFYATPQINPDGEFNFSELFYFSFVTLATLGYGDIVPVGHLARSLAVIEAIAGSMFIAILIGVLIGSFVERHRSSKLESKPKN